jgi:hypothetical protein
MDLFDLSEILVPRAESDGFDRLSDAEKDFVAIWTLEADINNGGFDQYFFNSGGDYAFHAPKALKAIGASAAAAIVESANATFGAAGPPRNENERRKALERLTDREATLGSLDQRFFEYPDDIQGLLEAYVESRTAAFSR